MENEERLNQLECFIGKPRCILSSAEKAALKAKQNRLDSGVYRVICIETQQIFESITEASNWAGGNIYDAIQNKGYSSGYH